MSDAPRLRTLSGIIYEQTEAQWAVDNRIFGSNVQLVPIDGANQGKHKLGNGINTYAELSFVEDSGASTSVKVDGMAQSGIAAFTGATDVSGQVTFNLTALIPGASSITCIARDTLGSAACINAIADPNPAAFVVAFAESTDPGTPIQDEPVICTFAYKL